MSVHYPQTLRRYNHYRKKDDFVVIKYGAEWCGPCKKITPILESLSSEHKHVYFLDVDIENEEILEHSDLKNVRTIPHIKFFVDCELKREIIGVDKVKLHRYVKRYSEHKLNQKSQVNKPEQIDVDNMEEDEIKDILEEAILNQEEELHHENETEDILVYPTSVDNNVDDDDDNDSEEKEQRLE